MEIPNDLLYTREHEWVKIEGNKGTVGITHFAQDQLGDVVFVELPQVDSEMKKETPFGVVESVKTVSDLYAPTNGKVTGVNKDLEAQPELINTDPYGKGWIAQMDLSDPGDKEGLLTPQDYESFIKEQEG